MHPNASPARDTGMWADTRTTVDPARWDEPQSKQSREFLRPVLRPVPDLPEPTLQVDTSSFFEPEHPRSRNRRSQEMPQVVQPALFQPAPVEMEQPALIRAAATNGPPSAPGGLGSRINAPAGMSASNRPPQGPPEPPRMPDPAYPTAPGFAPESFPGQRSQPPSPSSGRPDLPAFPPPEPFDETKQGRFGMKGRKAEKPAAAATPPPVPSPSPAVPAAGEKPKKEKVKKDKKGLFGPLKGAPKAATPSPPPPGPARPAPPPKPRFAAPFNYIPPNAPPPAAKPAVTYPKASSGPVNRPWGPPANFSPPASPSFSNWGPPKPADQAPPAPEPQNIEPPATPGEPFTPPSPNFSTGNGHGLRGQEPPAGGPWSFGFDAGEGNPPAGPAADPVLPAFIELSMFQDPTSADDIAAEQEADEAAEPVAGNSGAQEAWLADDAWPAPSGSRSRKHDPWPMEQQPAEETQLLEQHWPQETPEPEEAPGPDWTSADTPWPGETRRPSEPSWANEAPAAESMPIPQDWETPAAELHSEPPRWGDEPWQQEVLRPETQPAQWHQELQPQTQQWSREPEPPAEDVWGREVRFRPAAQPPADPWQAARPPAEYADDPWVQARQAGRPEPSAPQVREVEAVPTPVAPPVPEQRAPAVQELATPEPASHGPQLFVDDDDDWEPRSIDVKLDEPAPPADPVAEAAARLRAAETAIKVDHGLAYVLVDDEGRAVLR